MIIDIRKEQKEEITGIKFDDSEDYITFAKDGVNLKSEANNSCRYLTSYEDFDNFIAAIHKAKELAGK